MNGDEADHQHDGIQNRMTELTDNLLDGSRPTNKTIDNSYIQNQNQASELKFESVPLMQEKDENPYHKLKAEDMDRRESSASLHSKKGKVVQDDVKREKIVKDTRTGANKLDTKPDMAKLKEKVKDPTKKLMQYLKNEWGLFTLGMVALLGGNFGIFMVPLYVGWVINALAVDDMEIINQYCIQLACIVFVTSIFVMIRGYLFNLISEKIARRLREDIFRSIINKDVAFFDERKTGDLLSRLNSDTSVIQDGLSTNVSMFVRSLIFIILSFIILFYISWQLTLATLACIVPLIFFGVLYGKAMKITQKKIQDNKAQISTIAEESFSNVRTVKAFATEKEEMQRYIVGNEAVFALGKYKAEWYGAFNFIANLFGYGSMCVIIYLGAQQVDKGDIDIGNITSFLLYMMQLLLNFMLLASVLGSVMSVIGASYKIVEIMEHIPDINTEGGRELDAYCKGEIQIQNVKFSYPTKKDVNILKGVTIDIQKNKVIALVGQSGCGKSSIIAMIERFYDPTEGQICFDGVNIKELNPKWYHQQVAIVSQEPVLFSGTIKENISYGYEAQATIEELDRACRQANAYDFIHDMELFPDGYDTIVGERGVKLSGGQKQRIAIARALIRKPKVLLLDEATSALDAESEHQVQKALDELIKSGDQTIIVIAHRLSTIRDADEIIVIKKGEIAERGTHDELLKKGKVYKALVERQLMAMQLEEEDNDETSAKSKKVIE